MIDTLEDFEKYIAKYNRLPGGFGSPLKKQLTPYQIEKKFNTYVKRENKKQEKKLTKIVPFSSNDIDWVDVKAEVRSIDKGKCQLLESLRVLAKNDSSMKDIYEFAKNQYNPENALDPAHVLSRKKFPRLKYNAENIVTLSRVFHSRIDYSRNPVTGELCSKEAIDDWWDIILTIRSLHFQKTININYLKELSNKLRRTYD